MNNSQIFDTFFDPFLTTNSKFKMDYDNIYLNHSKFDMEIDTKSETIIKTILDKMLKSFVKEINIKLVKPTNLKDLQDIFINFDRELNMVNNSRFQKNIKNTDTIYTFNLNINNDNIKINFLFNSSQKIDGYISAILHALHTFCYLFPYNYNNLTINISLDDNYRDLDYYKSYNNYNDIFNYLHQKSLAFNVSGVTNRFDKTILLTKNEEIIKLMYHELIHFIGLDHELLHTPIIFTWAIKNNKLNLSETYTEFIAIILNSMYQSIHLASLKKEIKYYDLFKKIIFLEYNYSLYLTSSILKFYGYNVDTFINFFNNIGEKKFSPILTWEYIILRTQLFLNWDKLFNIVGNNWQVTQYNKNNIVELTKIDDNFLNKIHYFMEHTNSIENISYTMVDFNWNLI